jgi:hypothetical protein
VNPHLQKAVEESAEVIIGIQKIRRDLTKLKDIIDTIVEEAEDNPDTETEARQAIPEERQGRENEEEEENEARNLERRRKQAKFTKRLAPILRLLPDQTMQAYFGSTSHEEIWRALNTSADHRTRVIEWLDALLTTQVSGEIEEMNKKAGMLKIQESYRTSKGITMRRYIDKEQSPQCPIEMNEVTDHFTRTWAKPEQQFIEAEPESRYHLEAKITDDEEEKLQGYLLDEKKIAEVIKSRDDLSANGTDGISYRVIKAAGAEGVKFVRTLVRGIIKSGRVMKSWKEARTILIHKKGNRDEIGNWRPISITNCMYRIFTCLMARAIQDVNSRIKVFADTQKGFIQKTNGCSEHGILLNELLYDAHRNKSNLVVTAIDFTNAFGSVPHELIMSTMKQRNFPSWTLKIVADLYDGATSVIEKQGTRSEQIPWKRGVKQGCPLSPLLFNLCLEPLLQAVTSECGHLGALTGSAEDKIRLTVQAYADDVIFISNSPEGVEQMLQVLEEFVDWSRMEVNVKKCATASYLRDMNRHRCSLTRSLNFKGQQIPNLTLAQSLKYLGTAVAPRRTVKLEAAKTKITEMKIRLKKIIESPLLIVQKIDAMKTFVLPMIDFMMLNGDVGEKLLMTTDKYIRGKVDELLKVRGLPVECHHASWRDGGLSYPSLVDRRRVLMIRSYAQMMTSKDEKVKKAMRWFTDSERQYRLIREDPSAQFLNWEKEDGRSEKGTGSLIPRTRNTCYKLDVSLKMNDDEMTIKSGESELKTTTAVGIGCFLTQKLVRVKKFEKLIQHQLHGASYTTLQNNESSNAILTDVYTRRSDAFYRFTVVG